MEQCRSIRPSAYAPYLCTQPRGHYGLHRSHRTAWTDTKIPMVTPLPTLPGGTTFGVTKEEEMAPATGHRTGHRSTDVVSIPKGLFDETEFRQCEVPECLGASDHRVQHICCDVEYYLCPTHTDHLNRAFATRETQTMMCENCAASPVPRPFVQPLWML